jgi:hypothetical protein
MTDARQSMANAPDSPIASALHELLDPESLEREYFKELPG